MRRYYIKVGARVGSPFFLCQTTNEGDYQWLCGDKVNYVHTQRFVLPGNEYSISSDYCLMIMSNRD